ncbi:carboxylesterase family protein, partial [Nocardia cyriacigeorgica]|uniref:carboxylesterase family protein n=1 Tax=Nocardia cyriacigeorgica TaxID=135487 RepID=UPI002455760F
SPPQAWDGIRDTVEPGEIAPQNMDNTDPIDKGLRMREDCLWLNVFAPALDGKAFGAGPGCPRPPQGGGAWGAVGAGPRRGRPSAHDHRRPRRSGGHRAAGLRRHRRHRIAVGDTRTRSGRSRHR